MQQELSRTQRLVVVMRGVGPRSDVHVAQPGLALLDLRVSVAQVHTTRAQRFDLRPGQSDAGLDAILDRVVERRLAVVRELQIARPLLGRVCWWWPAVGHGESVQSR